MFSVATNCIISKKIFKKKKIHRGKRIFFWLSRAGNGGRNVLFSRTGKRGGESRNFYADFQAFCAILKSGVQSKFCMESREMRNLVERMKEPSMDRKFYLEILLVILGGFLYSYDPENTNIPGLVMSLTGFLCLYLFCIFLFHRCVPSYRKLLKYLEVILCMAIVPSASLKINLGMRDFAMALLLFFAMILLTTGRLQWMLLLAACAGPFLQSNFLFTFGFLLLLFLLYQFLQNRTMKRWLLFVLSAFLMTAATIHRYPSDASAWFSAGQAMTSDFWKMICLTALFFLPLLILLVLMMRRILAAGGAPERLLVFGWLPVLVNYGLSNLYGRVTFEVFVCILSVLIFILLSGTSPSADALLEFQKKFQKKCPWHSMILLYLFALLPIEYGGASAVVLKVMNLLNG